MTRVQGIVNISYERFRGFVYEMLRSGLISIEKGHDYNEIRLQQKGSEYLRLYSALKECL